MRGVQGRSVRVSRIGLGCAAAAVMGVGLLGAVGPAAAQTGCCAGGPVVVYGAAPLPPAVPPTGYVLDPSDARPPMYVVNQGPVYRGPGIYAVPTFSEGGYAYSIRYPYTYGPWYGPAYRAPYRRPYGYPARRYGAYVGPETRPAGAPPYGAYEVRPSPSAKIVHVQQVAHADPSPTGSVTRPAEPGKR